MAWLHSRVVTKTIAQEIVFQSIVKVHSPIVRHLSTSFLFAIKEVGVSAKFKLKEDTLLSVTTDAKYFKLRDCLYNYRQ